MPLRKAPFVTIPLPPFEAKITAKINANKNPTTIVKIPYNIFNTITS
jgi:hypothetical protein